MKLSIAVLLTLCITQVALAQPRHHRAPNIDRLTKDLQLSSEQAADVEAILTEHHELAGNKLQASREAMGEQRQATRERLAGVLDEEQLETFDAMAAKRRARRDERRAEKREGREGRKPSGQ
ncbi:MAG: hypothetical protein AB8B86_16445 [Pseudomonadales bacterium]